MKVDGAKPGLSCPCYLASDVFRCTMLPDLSLEPNSLPIAGISNSRQTLPELHDFIEKIHTENVNAFEIGVPHIFVLLNFTVPILEHND